MTSSRDSMDRAKFRSEIARNNLIACLIHVSVTVLVLVWTVVLFFMGASFIQSQLEQAIFALAFIVMPMIVAYVYLGYRFLRPLPKLNFLSVLALLTIFLLSNALALVEASAFFADYYHLGTWETFPLSYFAMIINFFIYYSISIMLVVGLLNIVSDFWLHVITMFVAALIPSSLMYLGIRLNVKYASRQELNKEAKSGESIAREETFEEIPSDWSEEVFRTGESMSSNGQTLPK